GSILLDSLYFVLYTGLLNLNTIGHLVAELRRARGLTLRELAVAAGIGRSTLAALESGKLPELGFAKVARLCAAVDLALEARPLATLLPQILLGLQSRAASHG